MALKKLKVGITYDLRGDYLKEGYSPEEIAEFDFPSTIDALEKTIQDIGYQTDRIGNIKSLVRRLAAGDRWNLVQHRRRHVRLRPRSAGSRPFRRL